MSPQIVSCLRLLSVGITRMCHQAHNVFVCLFLAVHLFYLGTGLRAQILVLARQALCWLSLPFQPHLLKFRFSFSFYFFYNLVLYILHVSFFRYFLGVQVSICALAHMCWTVVYVHESLHVFQSASSSYFLGQNFSMNLKLDGLTRLSGWHSSGLPVSVSPVLWFRVRCSAWLSVMLGFNSVLVLVQ